ncbi:MAG TPA: heparan-alpha-glucosaminide N-acetyltransferase domain-containing protein [Ohtaekwangia sp.]|uniref:acyltransferase family protein n=1 Tax=Ohtaekwangia sp. TaxID=2066019 RepID=UPI002F92E3DB
MAENQRFLALDVFRGMTVCFMIIVNSPGDWSIAYAPLLHARWHGFTPTDLVFPSFLFAVGNAMAFVMYKYESLGDNVFWRKTLKRFFIIFLLGFLMYWFPFYDFESGGWKPLSETRILGVLQRIALCYLIASIVLHYTSKKVAVAFSVVLLLGYWLLLYIYGDPNDPYSMAGYGGNALDFLILGEKHLYHGEGVAFDPEGILSTLPAIVNVIFGYLAGDFIRKHGNSYETIAKLLMAGAVLIFLALTWNMVFPINKKIWTSSFVLLTVGLDLLILPILMFLIEIKKKQKWTYFFVVFGRNPLSIYLLSELLLITLYLIPVKNASLQHWIYRDFLGSFASPINASFLFAVFFMLTCWLVGYIMDKKKVYIRV